MTKLLLGRLRGATPVAWGISLTFAVLFAAGPVARAGSIFDDDYIPPAPRRRHLRHL